MEYTLKVGYSTMSGKKKSFSVKDIKADINNEDAVALAKAFESGKLVGNDTEEIDKLESLTHIGVQKNEINIQ